MSESMSVIVANKGRYRGSGGHAPADDPRTVSITPPSALANHFKTSKSRERGDMVALYAAWLDAQLADPDSAASREFARLRAILNEHGVLVLLCGCAPLACHGDAIRARLLADGTPTSAAPVPGTRARSSVTPTAR